MPAHSKGLTERTSLRYTADEKAILTNVIRAHADVGITISLNDAVRVLIRRGGSSLPDDVPTAQRRFVDHVEACDACTADCPGCPDGWWLADVWGVEARGGGKCVWCEFLVPGRD